MASNTTFKSSYGLDAGGHDVTNVKTPTLNDLNNGVNVDFFIRENTLQHYDPTRGYAKKFAVIYENKIYTSLVDIPKPAGTFDETKWLAVRTDPTYDYINSTISGGTNLTIGQYVIADNSSNDLHFILPDRPPEGTTVTIYGIGKSGINQLLVETKRDFINVYGTNSNTHNITKPYAHITLTYNSQHWNIFYADYTERSRFVAPSASATQVFAGESIYRRSSLGKINLQLPKLANHGDQISGYDLDGMTPVNHLSVSVHPDSDHSVERQGLKDFTYRTTSNGVFIFDGIEKLWRGWDGDQHSRLKIVESDTTMLPNDRIMVFGKDEATAKSITLTLPTKPAIGDTAIITLKYLRSNQKVTIKSGTGDYIATNKTMMQFPQRSEYPPIDDWVTTETLEFDGSRDYVPYLELSYVEKGAISYWVVVNVNPTVERVDPTKRDRLGVIALGTQTEVDKNHEDKPNDEVAVTPKTLANKTATETRRGLARIVTSLEFNKNTTDKFDDDTIVTPKKFNERTATETRRGVLQIATQTEANSVDNDVSAITAKKLNDRTATEGRRGVLKIVSVGGIGGVNRDTKGTGIYDYANHEDAVTPKTLFEFKSTYNALGSVYLATEAEVINAPVMNAKFPVVVTPVELHKKTATEGRIGFSQIATQAETDTGVNDFKYVTPKKLGARNAKEDLTGLARIATQTEFNDGTLDNVISTPLKIKTYFDAAARIVTDNTTGIKHTGSLWKDFKLVILPSSESQVGSAKISTQSLVDTGVDDKTIVTPLKLHSKKSTESKEGIIKVATQKETTDGTSANTAVSPKNLIYAIQTEKTWEATTLRRGTVKLTDTANTWVGDDVQGSTKTDYLHDGYAISPQEMNSALKHYLPIKATAVNSTLFNSLNSGQFIRRDVNQDVNGILTMNSKTVMKAPLVSASTGQFTTLDLTSANTSLKIGNNTGWSGLHILGAGGWALFSASDTNFKIQPIDEQNPDNIEMFSINRTSGDVKIAKNLNVGGTFNSSVVQVGSKDTLTISANRINIGNRTTPISINTPNASDIIVNEASTSYKFITTKNLVEESNKTYVRKDGDTMSNRLTINSTLVAKIPEMTSTQKISTNTMGNFAINIINNKLTYPQEKEGVLAQFGSDATKSVQLWSPQGTNKHFLRSVNADGTWSTLGEIYTKLNKPTAEEIGAAGIDGTEVENIKIREYIDLGPVRMSADPVTKSVKFEWIGY